MAITQNMIEITFLGTSAMVPTRDRNHSAVFLSYKGEGILIDCGEGTQRQLRIAEISALKIKKILLSHWHGDHVFGLPGLLQTMSALGSENQKVQIFGPKGTKKAIASLFKTYKFKPSFELEIKDVKEEKFFENEEYELHARLLDHTITCLGYRLQEKNTRRINVSKIKSLGIPDSPMLGELQKGNSIIWKGKKYKADDLTTVFSGKIVSYVCDTALTKNCFELAKDADLLICEASYADTLADKAEGYKHMTARDAATLASTSNVKRLVVTHFSQRYKTVEEIEDNAKTIFPDTVTAFDFLKLKV